MLFTHKEKAPVKLFQEGEFTAQDHSPVLHVCNEDGVEPKKMTSALKSILHPQTEWYLAYGPDAILWSQHAEIIQIAEIEKEVDSEYNFCSLAYDEDSQLSLAIHKLISLSSHIDNNQVYKHYNIVTDSLEESKRCLESFGFTSEP